mmetsp:Transcript_49361/g.120444  ORF Transcript_49361/g.120444 Transcript_49361/m.120444 type:complete len:216 (-) Transcript_49361:575-1222(-)
MSIRRPSQCCRRHTAPPPSDPTMSAASCPRTPPCCTCAWPPSCRGTGGQARCCSSDHSRPQRWCCRHRTAPPWTASCPRTRRRTPRGWQSPARACPCHRGTSHTSAAHTWAGTSHCRTDGREPSPQRRTLQACRARHTTRSCLSQGQTCCSSRDSRRKRSGPPCPGTYSSRTQCKAQCRCARYRSRWGMLCAARRRHGPCRSRGGPQARASRGCP